MTNMTGGVKNNNQREPSLSYSSYFNESQKKELLNSIKKGEPLSWGFARRWNTDNTSDININAHPYHNKLTEGQLQLFSKNKLLFIYMRECEGMVDLGCGHGTETKLFFDEIMENNDTMGLVPRNIVRERNIFEKSGKNKANYKKFETQHIDFHEAGVTSTVEKMSETYRNDILSIGKNTDFMSDMNNFDNHKMLFYLMQGQTIGNFNMDELTKLRTYLIHADKGYFHFDFYHPLTHQEDINITLEGYGKILPHTSDKSLHDCSEHKMKNYMISLGMSKEDINNIKYDVQFVSGDMQKIRLGFIPKKDITINGDLFEEGIFSPVFDSNRYSSEFYNNFFDDFKSVGGIMSAGFFSQMTFELPRKQDHMLLEKLKKRLEKRERSTLYAFFDSVRDHLVSSRKEST